MKKLNFLPLMIIAAATATACTDFLHPEYVKITELGALVKTDTLPSLSGDCTFPVKSNVDFVARVVKGAQWLSFDENDTGMSRRDCPASSQEIRLFSTANTGFPRMGLVVLEANGRSDTVYVKQEGKYKQFVKPGATEIIAAPAGGKYTVDIDTNVPARDILATPDKNGIEATSYKDNVLTITVSPNTGRNDRTILLSIYCLDEWRQPVGSTLTIKQKKL